jgi:hypothetical protein
LDVVKEQLERALDVKPPAIDFDAFSANLENLSYAQIKTLWDQERNRDEKRAEDAEPIRQLREALSQEIISIIAEQRTLFLTDGSRFIKTSGRGVSNVFITF